MTSVSRIPLVAGGEGNVLPSISMHDDMGGYLPPLPSSHWPTGA